MEVSPLAYVGFIGFVVAMLLLDLRLFQTDDETEPTTKESGTWVTVWVSLALIFGVALYFWQGGETAAEYFAGYLIEYSLSVDNMFVFIVIFQYFSIPFKYQHRVLFFGILGALIFRGIFIAVGAALIHRFEWIIYIFGVFLIITAIRLAKSGGAEVHPEKNPVLKFTQRRFPSTKNFEGHNLFTVENGKRLATPLFITLVFIEVTDIVFALDSIPAIFGITNDPFIVLTSNVFAILGLRSLYFLLAGALNRLHLLNYGLAFVLGFVGVKMLLEAVHVEVPIWMSLAVIVLALGITTWLSLKTEPPEAKEKAEAPS
ncbi:MAG: TerC family protein [Actinomycetota bacterium]|nr:TerC family protein [Actinomycetota bacterium]